MQGSVDGGRCSTGHVAHTAVCTVTPWLAFCLQLALDSITCVLTPRQPFRARTRPPTLLWYYQYTMFTFPFAFQRPIVARRHQKLPRSLSVLWFVLHRYARPLSHSCDCNKMFVMQRVLLACDLTTQRHSEASHSEARAVHLQHTNAHDCDLFQSCTAACKLRTEL